MTDNTSTLKDRTRFFCLWLLAILSTYAIFYRTINTRVLDILDPSSFNGDALQHISPLWFLRDMSLHGHDYIRTYYFDAILPPLFKFIYSGLIIFVTPITACKVMSLVLCAGFITILTFTSFSLGGFCPAYITLLLATGGVLKNIYFAGGMQRGFGICLASLSLYSLISGRVKLLGLLGVAAVSLYPASSVLVLIISALVMLLPARLRGSAASWGLAKRISWLLALGILSATVAAPQLIAGKRYGDRLSIAHEPEFPEWGNRGRYTSGDRGVPIAFLPRSFSVMVRELSARIPVKKKQDKNADSSGPQPRKLTPSFRVGLLLVFTTFCGIWALRCRSWHLSPHVTRAFIYPIGTAISFAVANLFSPLLYIPSRYIVLGFVPLAPIVLPCVWNACAQSILPRSSALRRNALSLSIGCLAFLWLAWPNVSFRSLASASGYRPLFHFMRELPRESVIAAWPKGIAEMIPFFADRSVLLFAEGHQVFHRSFAEESRARMRAIIAAYAATDKEPIEALRTRYGVTHIVVDVGLLGKTPSYFEPFNSEMIAARDAAGDRPLYLSQLIKTHVVFKHRSLVVVDITKDL